jgi:hypothetical protein
MATHDNRDPALYNGNRGARHRLAPRQNAQAVLIGAVQNHLRSSGVTAAQVLRQVMSVSEVPVAELIDSVYLDSAAGD